MQVLHITYTHSLCVLQVAKVIDKDFNSSSLAMFEAMLWAYQNDAKIISMSLSLDVPRAAEHYQSQGMDYKLAVNAAVQDYRQHYDTLTTIMHVFEAGQPFKGFSPIVVAAAGDDSDRRKGREHEMNLALPAAVPGMLSVGALAESAGGRYSVPYFSNTGPTMCAPGVNVWSAKAGEEGLVSMDGTAFAVPHVAGAAALWWHALAGSNRLAPSAGSVIAYMRSSCCNKNMAPDVELPDYGDGMVQCPYMIRPSS